MIEVTDRVPTKPNRIKLVSEDDGTSAYYTLSRADEPTVDGTPINKALFDSIQEDLDDIGNLNNDNILINSDFRKTINSRGNTTYSGTGSINVIDRWVINNGITLTVNDSSITLSHPSSATYTGRFKQTFKNGLPKDYYTISMNVISCDGCSIAEFGSLASGFTGVYTFTSIETELSSIEFYLNPGNSMEIEWIKLERGKMATLLSPNQYYKEIAFCEDVVTSSGSDYGEVATWSDGNPDSEDRLYRFVTIVGANRELAIADSTSQIVGTSNIKNNVGFLGNYNDGDEDDTTKAIVSILGVSYVKTEDSTIVANDRVMSDDNGYAVKSSNNLGYRVLNVVEEGLLEIVVSPNTDMIQRIKTDMPKYVVGTDDPTTDTCPEGYFYFKISE